MLKFIFNQLLFIISSTVKSNSYKKSYCKLSRAVISFLILILSVGVPLTSDAQSWLKQLEQAGKQILNRTVDDFNKGSQDQQDQQPKKISPPPNNSKPSSSHPQAADKQAKPTSQSSKYSKPSYTHAQVREVQQLLKDMDYEPGPVDGIYGNVTAKAIRAYQSDHGIPQTGVPSNELIAHILNTRNAEIASDEATTPTPSWTTHQQVSDNAFIRSIQPVQSQGRIITGYTLMHGRFNAEKAKLGQREVIKSHLDLALYIDLTVLKQWPDLFDDQRIAFKYANRFLLGSELSRYVAGCSYGSCSPHRPYDGWVGANEFEREASYRGFVKNYRPVLLERAASMPLELLQIFEVELQSYDKTNAAFPIKLRRPSLSVLATVPVAASRLATEITYTLPSEVSVSRDQAPEILATVQAQQRKAYIAVKASLGQPDWNHIIDRPEVHVQLQSAALFADPVLKRKVYAFQEPSRKTIATGKTGSASSSNIVVSSPDIAPIPTGLLLYKYKPDSFNDELLLRLTKQQIGKDQAAFKYPQTSSDHVFVFSKEQIEDRVVDFAAKELLPYYKRYLDSLVGQIPRKLYFTRSNSLNYLEYHSGVLRKKSRQYLSREYKLSENRKQDIPHELQHLEILGSMPEILGRFDDSKLADSIRDFKVRGRNTLLALDRDPEVPPIAMKSARAERMWKKPECSIFERYYLREGATKAAARKAAQECRARLDRYEPAVKTNFEITIESVTVTERAWIIQANLVHAEVYSPRQKLLKTFAANDFKSSVEKKLAAEQKEEKMAQAEAAQEQLEAKKRASMAARIGTADINGLTLSMSFAEAEAAVRNRLDIGRIREKDSTGSTSVYTRYFNDMKQYENVDGSERIMLFRAKPNSQKLVGIGRMLDLPKGTKLADVKDQLVAKYGEPTGKYKLDDGLRWHGHKDKQCVTSIGWTSAPAIKEGKRLSGFEKYGSFHVSLTYRVSGKPENEVLKELRDQCSPQLIALVQMSRLLVVLLDIPAYAAENIDEDEETDVKLDL